MALQTAHLQLSLFLRSENNRYYLRNGLELRPGYLAKWIQVSILLDNDPATIINNITERQQSQTLAKEKLKAQLAKTSSRGLPPKYLERSELEDVNLSRTDLEAQDRSHTIQQLNSASNMSSVNIIDKNEELKVYVKGEEHLSNHISIINQLQNLEGS